VLQRLNIGFKDVVINGERACVRYTKPMHRRKIKSWAFNERHVRDIAWSRSDNFWLRMVFGYNQTVMKYV